MCGVCVMRRSVHQACVRGHRSLAQRDRIMIVSLPSVENEREADSAEPSASLNALILSAMLPMQTELQVRRTPETSAAHHAIPECHGSVLLSALSINLMDNMDYTQGHRACQGAHCISPVFAPVCGSARFRGV